MSIRSKISTGFHLLKLTINPQKNIKSLIYVGNKVIESRANQFLVGYNFHSKIIQQKYLLRTGMVAFDLETLKGYAVGTLGAELYLFYTKNKLDVYPIKHCEHITQHKYLGECVRKLHDPLHVVLDYGIDLAGEAQVNAFVASQSRSLVSFLIIMGVFLRMILKAPSEIPDLVAKLETAWQRGKKCRHFMEIEWDAMMHLSLDEARGQLVGGCGNRRYIPTQKKVS